MKKLLSARLARVSLSTMLLLPSLFCFAQSFTAEELHRYAGEAGRATIIRDRWGIPHIYGKTDADVVFGLLYAECETDFSRVEKNYLEMLGRQAEAFGEDYLYNDLQMRLIYDSAAAQRDYQASPVWMHKLLDAFADGVNYYLYKHPEVKPLVLTRFEPWFALMFTDGSVSATSTGGISLNELKYFYSGQQRGAGRPGPGTALATGLDQGSVSAAGFGQVPGKDEARENDESLVEREGVEMRETGSNGFAIAPSRSASGNALLWINPHVPFYFRIEVQMVSEEGLNAYGAVTWGQFFVYQGFNAHCGWMHTSSYADVADAYMEKVTRQEHGWVYEYEGKSKAVRTKLLTVYYKKEEPRQPGQIGKSAYSLNVPGFYTEHGPVMGIRDGKWLSVKEYNRSLEALMEAWLITKANSFAAYKKAMAIRANTTNNTVYADDQGNIAYWHGNFMPRRDTAYDWSLPVDGTIAATQWKGLHGLDEIVHVYNPASGWIQNCNSTPFSSSGSSSPDPRNYPAYMAPDGENFRALNAARLLSGAGPLTLDSLMVKGYDRYLTAFDRLLPALLAAYDGAGDPVGTTDSTRTALREPIAVLRNWDRRSGLYSVATTLAVEWGTRMSKYAPKPRTTEEGSHALAGVEGELAHSTAAEKLNELSAVIADLQTRFGSWKIEWGELCRYQRLTGKITETYDDHQPSLPSAGVSSSFGALPSFQSRVMNGTKKRYGYSGNSFIAAVEFGKKVKAKTLVTGGESSDPASPHFSDQAAMYLEGQFKDVLFYKEDVLHNMESTYHPGEK